jgi:plastocyanin
MEKLKRSGDPVCAKKDFADESVLVKDGKLENVVVRLIGDSLPAGPAPSEPVVVDQTDCMYRPRVQGAVEGQKVQIKNDDNTLHNVHSYAAGKTLFNKAQPAKFPPIEPSLASADLAKGDDVLTMKCDVHPWMRGYVVFSKSPFYAVTQADGRFTLKGVPPGTYTLQAWHEKLGTQTSEVKVVAGKTADVKFSFSAK